ncbi:3-dehydroquinate dehydratase [Caldisphaera lagunensis DSM 15908]|uniref:3-dehydroquinate dehydratase n=1 Tax=Caldisphaera lagunensis (strain DSM 15908 / JCM 11604 / ANMR 0165 / IC-154) TaxID=1056495 RepID=L0A9T2_CALLD|nr:type I 3-dehydroquinate dehydratase [Caldisphaera lagunensis]AFZ69902.1 3-dehydroquinate dehydratase [Caldisphaera lagunensis DSM 15908]
MNRPLIVLSLPYGNIDEYVNKTDLIEIRLDYKKNLSVDDIDNFLKFKDKIIITIRDINEGGIFPIKEETKIRIYKKLYDYGIIYDLEQRFLEKYDLPYENKIVSVHYLNNLPSFNEILEKFKKYNDLFTAKLAVRNIKGYKSILIKFLEVIENATAIPLGANWYERVAFSLLGSKLLYVYDKIQTGEGQPKLEDAMNIMKNIFKQ